MIETHTIMVITIIFLSTFFASTFGFGLGLVAMPLLAFILDVKTATPLIALIILSMAVLIFLRNWREVDFKSTWKIALGSMVGIPIGLYFLKGTGDSFMKITLALIIILFALYSLFGRIKLTLKAEWPAYIVGIVSGCIHGSYNMGAPPVVIYSVLKKWPPSTFRNTIQGLFLPTGLLTVISHSIAGLVTETVVHFYALSLPFVIFSIIIGGKFNSKIDTEKFHNLIHILLFLIGISLLINEI